jgi:hypothetical protein
MDPDKMQKNKRCRRFGLDEIFIFVVTRLELGSLRTTWSIYTAHAHELRSYSNALFSKCAYHHW